MKNFNKIITTLYIKGLILFKGRLIIKYRLESNIKELEISFKE